MQGGIVSFVAVCNLMFKLSQETSAGSSHIKNRDESKIILLQ